jgi:energy-coupling factor transporter ATP-binding protein EcfA2
MKKEKVAIIGENGIGKTTFLRCLAGDLKPKHGEVKWAEKANLGYFAQDHEYEFAQGEDLFEWMTAQRQQGDDDNTAGKAEADRFLAEGRITAAEHKELTTTPTPKTPGIAPSKPGDRPADRPSAAVSGDITFATKLTPSGFTLGQAIKNVTFPRTIAQLADNVKGLPAENIVNNLAALALNILEPIKAKYPNMLITNTYREGKGQAQHGTGQAADLQFRGVGAHSYFEIATWIEKNIPYDQLLLEYLPGKTVWIHISYAIPGLPSGGSNIRKAKPQNILATLNGAAGGKFTPNLHKDIIVAAVPNRVVAA